MAARGRRYFTQGQRAVNSSSNTLVGITGATTVRPGIYHLIFGSSATPADNAILWKGQRSTAAGTSTAFTPIALDPADPASTTASGYNHSGEPTYTANAFVFWVALNQRATHNLLFDPDGVIQVPATANNGVGIFPIHASFTGNVDATVYFAE